MEEAYRWVYMTTASREEAKTIGRALLESRLAACVNILDGMTSMYWWQGAIQEDRETVMIANTTERLFSEFMAKVKSLHSYDVPCIIALPIQDGFPDYLAWLGQETRKENT